ncbi:MAG TPA: VCBS repeat-containing protein [Crocinitomicaceae bacterium]|nr:VCBS repeat-containing protein [Crocinitomicaceae bacterium]
MKAKLFFLLLNLTLPNIICAQIFSEVSSEKGLNYLYPGNDFQMAGGGVMVIDYNNDGWEDFFQSGGLFDSKLWKNNHGTFEDVTDEVGLDALNGYFIQGAVSADYDNDGYEDFVIANYGVGMSRGDKKSPVLLHNIKGDYFEVIPLAYAVGKGNYASACWGDINKDGFVDLYFANYVRTMSGILDSSGVTIGYNPTCYENKLLINIQGKSFVEQSENYGLNNGGCGLSASFTDLDQDGDFRPITFK